MDAIGHVKWVPSQVRVLLYDTIHLVLINYAPFEKEVVEWNGYGNVLC